MGLTCQDRSRMKEVTVTLFNPGRETLCPPGGSTHCPPSPGVRDSLAPLSPSLL